jgi:hypothetical protein
MKPGACFPRVQAVIHWKWSRFCERLLLWELAFFLLWLASYWAFIIAIQVCLQYHVHAERSLVPQQQVTFPYSF